MICVMMFVMFPLFLARLIWVKFIVPRHFFLWCDIRTFKVNSPKNLWESIKILLINLSVDIHVPIPLSPSLHFYLLWRLNKLMLYYVPEVTVRFLPLQNQKFFLSAQRDWEESPSTLVTQRRNTNRVKVPSFFHVTYLLTIVIIIVVVVTISSFL